MTQETNTDFNAAAQSCEALWLASYDEGVQRSFTQSYSTIKEAMLAHLEGEEADELLIQYCQQYITRREADTMACQLANAMLDAGIKHGDRMSIVVSNRPEIVVAFMACYKAGFVAAAYNQRSTGEEIVRTIAGVQSSVLIIEEENLSKISAAIEENLLPSLRCVCVIGGTWGGLSHLGNVLVAPYEHIMETASSAEPAVEILPEDNALLLFTGGTTGVPKGCVQTHAGMVLELQSMHHWCAGALRQRPEFLVCMPMTHIMGINYGINWQLINGGSVAIGWGHKPEKIIEAFDYYQPTVWATLPTLLHSVANMPELEQGPYKDLDLVIFGGSFIARELLESLAAKTRGAFVESYGMSESFGFVTCNPVGTGGKVGSIGLPLCNTDMLVVDSDTGTHPLPPLERGEIIFRGPQIIKGYWNNPEETRVALRNGWLFSGDIGYMDEDGFFYLVDRKKDTIVVSGFNVFPKEIDELLLSVPGILDACTIGVPDEHSGERPKSFLVVDEGFNKTPDELKALCKQHLVAYKAPKYFEVIDEIPKTKARKPDRNKLKEMEAAKREKIGLDPQET